MNLRKNLKKIWKPWKNSSASGTLFAVWSAQSDFDEYGKIYVRYFKTAGPLVRAHVNNASWTVFEKINDPKIIAFAIQVMEPHKSEDIQSIDTYANLLYKGGRTKEAIEWEKKAVALAESNAKKYNVQTDPVYQAALAKMRKMEKKPGNLKTNHKKFEFLINHADELLEIKAGGINKMFFVLVLFG